MRSCKTPSSLQCQDFRRITSVGLAHSTTRSMQSSGGGLSIVSVEASKIMVRGLRRGVQINRRSSKSASIKRGNYERWGCSETCKHCPLLYETATARTLMMVQSKL